jgi:hypothetical protein
MLGFIPIAYLRNSIIMFNQQERHMKIVIDKPTEYVIDIELDSEALSLSDDDLSVFYEEAIYNLQSALLSLQSSNP